VHWLSTQICGGGAGCVLAAAAWHPANAAVIKAVARTAAHIQFVLVISIISSTAQ
jgi:hypothetical protein